MQLTESEQFKINLVDRLNKQRINGINCDIEIKCSFNNDRLYTHSIIINLFSAELMNYIEDKMKMSKSMCEINFPHEMSFVETTCFDCLKQVVNYLYEGEINIHPNHEAHVQSIVLNLKINKLIELLFSNIKVGWNENTAKCDFTAGNTSFYNSKTDDLSTSNNQLSNLACPESPNINQHSKMSGSTTKVTPPLGTNDTSETIMERDARHIIQSPLKKRLKFSRKYETIISEPEVNVTTNRGEEGVDVKSQMDENIGNQINHHIIVKNQVHSDGLHLLLSILEEQSKKELLNNNSRQVDSNSLATENNKTEDCSSTPIMKNGPEDKLMTQNEDHCIQEERVPEKNPGKKISQDESPCDGTQSIIDSKKMDNNVDECTLLIETKNHLDQSTLLNETQTMTSGEDSRLKTIGKPKKTAFDKVRENNTKRKTGVLKKKDNEEKVIGVQDGFICKKCKMFFDNISSLQEHMQSTHSKKLRCISCNFMTIKIRCFIDHLVQSRHEGTICSVCHYQTSTNEELHKHIIKHKANLPKPFFCNDCDKTFATRRIWSVHLPVHSNETQFLCAVCSKGFKWRQGLERHMTTHGKEKPYLCSQCAFNTVNQAYLAKHILSHNKKEVCPHEECKHREIRKENLKAHLLTHSKVKRFQCELCGKSFGHAKNLDRHLEHMHNPHTMELSCNQCNYVTVRLDKLKDHFKSRHKTYDYRQYVEQVKENLKTSSSTMGVKVNRHLMINKTCYPKQTTCGENQTSVLQTQAIPLTNSNSNQTSWSNPGHTITNTSILTLPTATNQERSLFTKNNTSILTIPVNNQDGSLFRVNTLETKNTALPILMNINTMTATTKNKVFVKTKNSSSLSNNPLNRTITSRTNKTRQQSKSHQRRKPNDSRKPTTGLKTILENKSENDTSRFRTIAIKPSQSTLLPSAPLLSNATPILLIISNTPKSQTLTNVSKFTGVKPVSKLILSAPIAGKLTSVNNTISDRNDEKPISDYSTFSSDEVNSNQCDPTQGNVESTTSSMETAGVPKYATLPTTISQTTITTSSGNYLPPISSCGNYLPTTSASSKYLPPTNSNNNYLPPTISSDNYLPPTSSSDNYLPPTSSSDNYLPPISSSGKYLPPTSSSDNYLPPISSSG
ncbi:hypothetical protein WDU94_008804, partial [Cyamophila willieti]